MHVMHSHSRSSCDALTLRSTPHSEVPAVTDVECMMRYRLPASCTSEPV